MKAKVIFLHALSPLHAGTGRGVGVIDLPIAREKSTGIPIVPGSSIKGVMRANCKDQDKKVRIFGPETGNASDYAGSVQFSDLRLLFLPVRSLAGTFAWTTSPLLLLRFQRDMAMADKLFPAIIPNVNDEKTCLVTSDSKLKMDGHGQIVLEDLLLKAAENDVLSQLSDWLGAFLFTDTTWMQILKERVCIVHDDVLSFLLDTATEITARIQLDKAKKTVKQGALWYEEALPTESILAGLMVTQKVKANASEVIEAITQISETPLQVGGSATVGRGLCRVRLV